MIQTGNLVALCSGKNVCPRKKIDKEIMFREECNQLQGSVFEIYRELGF